jgi:hypothetical protein
MHASNAYMRAFDAEFNPLSGYGGVGGFQPPSLGDALIQVKLKNTAPGAPLPDLNQLQACPEPGQAWDVISLRARASGPLRAEFGVPEGTPGRLEVTQTGLFGTSSIASLRSRLTIALTRMTFLRMTFPRTGGGTLPWEGMQARASCRSLAATLRPCNAAAP